MYCKRCKKIFSDGYLGMCRDCMRELDDVVIQVKEFLKKEHTANIPEICEKTEISEKDILYLLKIGRLVLDEPSELLKCKKCGRPILSGKYCKSCSSYLNNILTDTAKKMSPVNEGARSDGKSNDSSSFNKYWQNREKKD